MVNTVHIRDLVQIAHLPRNAWRLLLMEQRDLIAHRLPRKHWPCHNHDNPKQQDTTIITLLQNRLLRCKA